MATVADGTVVSQCKHTLMNFVRKSLNSLVKLRQMFKIAEIELVELGMENTNGITLETGVGIQSAILHVCQFFYHSP